MTSRLPAASMRYRFVPVSGDATKYTPRKPAVSTGMMYLPRSPTSSFLYLSTRTLPSGLNS